MTDGYSLQPGPGWGVPADARIGWWAGNGGSMSFIDLDARMSIGYTPNRWLGGAANSLERSGRLIKAAYACLAR